MEIIDYILCEDKEERKEKIDNKVKKIEIDLSFPNELIIVDQYKRHFYFTVKNKRCLAILERLDRFYSLRKKINYFKNNFPKKEFMLNLRRHVIASRYQPYKCDLSHRDLSLKILFDNISNIKHENLSIYQGGINE